MNKENMGKLVHIIHVYVIYKKDNIDLHHFLTTILTTLDKKKLKSFNSLPRRIEFRILY